MGERAIFFRHWLKHPLGIGAVVPSSRAVAQAMARELKLARPGIVLELGGGTGTITRGLLEAGCPPERLVVVERELELVRVLRERFPEVTVLAADVRALDGVLWERGIAEIATVISSLPIKWFPLEDQRAVVDACFARLGAGGPLLQLTNAVVSPLPVAALGLLGVEVAWVWKHLPPVQIWRYVRPEAC